MAGKGNNKTQKSSIRNLIKIEESEMESENQKVISEAEELPRTIVRRVVKEKLSHDGDDMSVHKDALLAFSESARIFIHYLSATYLIHSSQSLSQFLT